MPGISRLYEISVNVTGAEIMLIENTLFGIKNKVKTSIDRLKEFEPPEGYYLAFSGGKDSIVIKALANMAGIKYDAHYNLTTIDPPDLIYFIREYHQDVKFEYPEKSFFELMIKNGYPTRQFRWCCKLLKEKSGLKRFVITGIRWAESSKRANRRMIEFCYKHEGKKYINPIIDWDDSDIWEFIKKYNISYCKLYDEGWKRIGCLFCPMNTQRKIHVKKYPGYVKLFIRYFDKRLNYAKSRNLTTGKRFKSGQDIWNFWINEIKIKKESDQQVIFE